jgi:DNA-binding FadR family transcriptional regulator
VGGVPAGLPNAADAVFGPVHVPTTFEGTVERLGTAIRLGLLEPGSRLPPERELADQFAISRSTLRQAILALTQSGHLVSLRGRTGGTFVADSPPLAVGHADGLPGHWRDVLDHRVAIEVGATLLACERAGEDAFERLDRHVSAMAAADDFPAYRRADVSFHLGLAEAAESPRLLAAMTEVQGEMTEIIARIAHPAAVLERANQQHERIVALLRRREGTRALRLVREHLEGTEHVLAGLAR